MFSAKTSIILVIAIATLAIGSQAAPHSRARRQNADADSGIIGGLRDLFKGYIAKAAGIANEATDYLDLAFDVNDDGQTATLSDFAIDLVNSGLQTIDANGVRLVSGTYSANGDFDVKINFKADDGQTEGQ